MAYALVKKSPLLLGYLDEKISPEVEHLVQDQIDYTTSKIGGLPNWIVNVPALSELACQICQSPTQLVCQIYAPLENSPFHRTLYIFACIQPPCWNDSKSWKCFRGQVKSEDQKTTTDHEIAQAQQKTSNFSLDWGVDSDWGDEETDNDNLDAKFTELNLSSQQQQDPNGNNIEVEAFGLAEAASGAQARECDEAVAHVESDQIQEIIIETPDEDLLANNTMVPELFAKVNNAAKRTGIFEPYFIAVEEESSNEPFDDMSEHERQLLVDYKNKESMVEDEKRSKKTKSVPEGQDGYEKVIPRHGDLGFHKFITTINKHPGHILRYCRDPQNIPLYLSKRPQDLPSGGPKKCSYCGGHVSCELQILPTLINSLKLQTISEAATDTMASLDYGNVLIYTCFQSCWDTDNYRREQVLVEAEAVVSTASNMASQ